MTTVTLPKSELIPGYVATSRIGSGGYGEVWRVEAPGGFEKAIKVVYGFHDDERATRELKALERIKRVRHPFVLSVERAEVIDSRLAILTELAEMSLDQRFEQCRSEDQPGIPRDELLGYMRDAADALDYLLQQHVLQHLDIKPENLLLVGGHVKVADFGLIKRVSERTEHSMVGGMTPTYAAPELFDGQPSSNSDQYSLAIVYQEMLTGTLPFPGRTSAQLAMQHTQGRPILAALPASDRDVVAKALAKSPSDRFDSCLEFVETLVGFPKRSRPDRQTEREQNDAEEGDELDADDTKSLGTCVTEPVAPAAPKSGPPASRLHPNACTEAIEPVFDSQVVQPGGERSQEQPAIEVSTEVIDAQIRAADTEHHVRPTFYLGIGRFGGQVVSQLRQKLADNEQTDWSALLPMLMLDTDRVDLQEALKGECGSRFGTNEVCHLPLRKSQHYRSESPKLLNWLSRRWLYNIPRSLQTRGLRPLGRLAMVDHRKRLEAALEERLRKLRDRPAGKEPPEEGEPSCNAGGPRVVLVASSDGGTGGGMLIDIAFAVRSLAKRLDFPSIELMGVVTHATGRRHEQTALALANTYALLSEISTIHQAGYRSSNSPDERTLCFEGDDFPFDYLYFLHLGDELSQRELHAAVQQVTEYLYLDAISSLGATLDACRRENAPADNQQEKAGSDGQLVRDVQLRAFTLAEVAGPPEVQKEAEAEAESDAAAQSETADREDANASLDARLADALQRATILPSGCGYTRRRLLLASIGDGTNELAASLARVAPGTHILAADLETPRVLCEAEGLSLAQIAAKLVESRPDAADAASRLHTRKDIDWQQLPQVTQT